MAIMIKKNKINCLLVSHLAKSPAQFNLVHAPKFMDVFSQFVPNLLQMRRHNNLKQKAYLLRCVFFY